MATMPRVPEYTVQKYSYVKQTKEGDLKFSEILKDFNWKSVTQAQTATQMVGELHAVFDSAMTDSYETRQNTRKSNQPPWINQYVLKLIFKRRTVFRREGRSDEWKKLKKRCRNVIKHRKAFYNKHKKEKMMGASSHSIHKCVKAMASDEKAKQWSPRQMYPELSAEQVAEKCAEFFNNISSEYNPLTPDSIPSTFEAEKLIITPKMVEVEITKGKKPKSRVPGDIFVNLIADNIKLLAPVIAKIYNKVIETGMWP